MKSSLKIILLTLTALINSHAFGLIFSYKNETTKPIVIKTMLRASLNAPSYQIVQPSETVEFNTMSGLCLESISYAPYKSDKPNNGGMDFVSHETNNIPQNQQNKFQSVMAPHYAFVPITIKSNANSAALTNLCTNLVITIQSTGKTDRRTRYEILNADVISSPLLQ